jgi:hypothetical protein
MPVLLDDLDHRRKNRLYETFRRYVAIGDSSTEGLEDPDGLGGYRGLGIGWPSTSPMPKMNRWNTRTWPFAACE